MNNNVFLPLDKGIILITIYSIFIYFSVDKYGFDKSIKPTISNGLFHIINFLILFLAIRTIYKFYKEQKSYKNPERKTLTKEDTKYCYNNEI